MANKEESFCEIYCGGKRWFQCKLCSRSVSSKHNILKHLNSQHGLSPMKPIKKLFTRDNKFPVPKSTLNRWRRQSTKLVLDQEGGSREANVPNQSSCDPIIEDLDTKKALERSSNSPTAEEMLPSCQSFESNLIDNGQIVSDDNNSETSDELLMEYDSSSGSSFSDEGLSSSNNTSDLEDIAELACLHESDAKVKAVQLLQCFKRHNLTASACKDMLKTVKHILPELDNHTQSLLCYEKLLTYIPTTPYKETHYCSICEQPVPDGEILECSTESCRGKVKSFMIVDIKEMLSFWLKAPGIFKDILKTVEKINQNQNETTISDIYSGELYKNINKNMPAGTLQLTAVMNTDGVNLYSSSKIELWPIFLAINELSPKLRFSRENLLVVGMWQGKGKPPFKQYLTHVSHEVNLLARNGMTFEFEGKLFTIYLRVLCITMDLPAKAAALNMTAYNGKEACITCEEPGLTVSQGRGHSKSYPCRTQSELFPIRSHNNVLELMRTATASHRIKGFKGFSGLAYLHKFDLVNGTVPDYMHAVLLGIVKTIMNKWFLPCQTGKDHFIGKELNNISERLLKVKPPYYIERLPRNLEKHYAHFKATELQSFLIYYALPCLHGFQQDKYLQHFALLSESIFILLGDQITENDFERSELLLNKFYSQFSELYGPGSCGLNVHNVCRHMSMYVRKLGPLWSWSCFPFEDGNAMILSSVHGTGDVVRQSLRNQTVSLYSRSVGNVKENIRKLKVTHKANNCDILGSMQTFRTLNESILRNLGVENCVCLKRVQRICVNNEKFYSAEYSRMKRRICNSVIYCGDKLGLIQYFALVIESNKVFAVIKKMSANTNSWVSMYEAGRHLKPMHVHTNLIDIIPADLLQRTVLFMEEGADTAIVVDLPNKHGHSVFK